LAVAGCAAPPPPPPPASGVAHGTILAMRPVAGLPFGEVSQVMAGLAGPLGLKTTPTLCEYIVRADDGRLMSVVQPPAPTLTPGLEVAIIRGSQTRLQPV
jgi:outer membrane lipoprotein SlyB